MEIVKDSGVIYTFCVNGDPHVLHRNLSDVVYNGGVGVHINVFSGLGSYRSIRQLVAGMGDFFIHFQKSGDRLFTNPSHDYHIKWRVICQLAVLSGVDFIHAGMFGGYSHQNLPELVDCCKLLVDGGVVPALSCGMHPGLVGAVREVFGDEWMANVGGALHGHPGGTGAGVRAMRQAIDKKYGTEYFDAVKKWG